MSMLTRDNDTAVPARGTRAPDDGGYGAQVPAPMPEFVIPVLEPDAPPVTPVISGAPPAVSLDHVRDVFVAAYQDEPSAFAPTQRTAPAGPPPVDEPWYVSTGTAPRFNPGTSTSTAYRFATGSMGIPHPRAAGGPAWPVPAPAPAHPTRARVALGTLTALIGLVSVTGVAAASVQYFGLVDVLGLLGL